MKLADVLAEHGHALARTRGEHLFHQGDTDRALYVVREGILKAYYLSPDGKEHIKSFIATGDTIGSLSGFFGEGGCTFNLLCLEDCALMRVDFETVYAACRDDLELANEILDFLVRFAMRKERREFELLCLPAETRYAQLRDTSPELIARVTQNDIARYLGVTPEGLSRIKRRLGA
ncbi:MAG: Crp/Fnr family transcriptional regulator [Pseudomonadota bacterium]